MPRYDQSMLPDALQMMTGPTSIVRAVRTILNAPGEPRLFSVASIPNSFARIAGSDMAGQTGAMSETWIDAASGAVGECVERYCCAVQPDDLVVATAEELGEQALCLDEFELFSERQYEHPSFPFARQTPTLPITWAVGKRLRDGQPQLVPACLIYIPYVPFLPAHTDMLALSVSSGQACHSDRTLAVLSGLYEVVERDAFMITWARRLFPTRVAYGDDEQIAQWMSKFFDGSSLTFDVFRLPSDIEIPTILCVAKGNSDAGPFACVGAACRLQERDAVMKAVTEAAQGAVWVRDLIATRPDWRPEPDFVNIRDFSDHVRLYGLPEMLNNLDFLYEGPIGSLEGGSLPTDPLAALEVCRQRVEAVGLDPIVFDITTDDVGAAGLSVVRVLIPGTAQLYAVHGLPTYGCSRYATVPKKLGFTDSIHQTFNPDPHPFP